ncbi:phosphopantetheine-binding protein [Candidatus Avelusimicrobium aviculae]|uniref:phosphopantetheine-binding protein n=1 Tax=Candidatus Avelusimicrobium aviculae TaxID=3416206 RepID=UPI003D145660
MNISREEIIRQTNEALKKEFELTDAQLTPQANLKDDIGLDSLDAVDMVVVLEQKFGMNIRQGYDLRSIVTLQDLYNFIEKIAQESIQNK